MRVILLADRENQPTSGRDDPAIIKSAAAEL
jgi:hypothetical protein